MIKFRSNWLQGLALFCAFKANAATLLMPLPQLNGQNGIFGPSLTLASNGIQAQTHAGGARVGSSFANLKGAFPLESSEQARISGWSWGVAVGASHYAYVPGVILVPSTYYWEVAAGRGTTELPTGGQSGIRGYFEVAFRDQRPKRENDLNQALNETQGHIEEHASSLVIRMGAGNDFAAEGLVEQKAPKISYRLEGAVYLPMAKYNRLYLSLQGKALTDCRIAGLGCGLVLNFLQSSNAEGIGSTAELYRHIAYGPMAEYRWNGRYAVAALMQWNWLVGTVDKKNKIRTNIHSAIPSFDLSAMMSF